jgi:hypothetical protein
MKQYDACAAVEAQMQSQVQSDFDDLGRAQQVTSELVDRLTSRLDSVLGPTYPAPPGDKNPSPEPSRCAVAGRIRASYTNACDVNGRLSDLVERLQV